MPADVKEEVFGKTKDGAEVKRFTLSSSNGSLVVRIISFGGAITEIHLADKDGKTDDICLGYDDVAGYEAGTNFFGSLNGRTANRIGGGQFTLDGNTYNLFKNDGPNTNHGGKEGFDKRNWTSRTEGDKLIVQYVSPDGEEGYPGQLTVTVTYTVTDDNQLSIDYTATTDKPTILNLTNHVNFNLACHNAGTLDDHVAKVNAQKMLPLDANSVPLGEKRDVEGTMFDLRSPVRLGDRMTKVPGEKGFDNCFCLPDNPSGKPQLAARMEHPPSGRFVECWTTEPGMQLYTSFYVDELCAKGRSRYPQFAGFCMEGQHFPDSIHHPSFPTTVLRPGETYRQTTIYKFGLI